MVESSSKSPLHIIHYVISLIKYLPYNKVPLFCDSTFFRGRNQGFIFAFLSLLLRFLSSRTLERKTLDDQGQSHNSLTSWDLIPMGFCLANYML